VVRTAVGIPQKQRVVISVLISVLFGFGFVIGLFIVLRPQPLQAPIEVARSYFLADYAHDYRAAWELISEGDKAFKTFDQYLTENALPTSSQSQLLGQFSSRVEFSPISIVSSRPDQTVVWARVRYPDLTALGILPLLESAASPDTDIPPLNGQLPFVEEEISFNLVDDAGFWRVVLHWDGAVTVRLLADVYPDLPWTFYPVEPEIQVMPGETVRTSYIARNNADHATTGKALHEILPLEHRVYLETVQCFCFTEQMLEAGEEREMTLIFRLDFTLPQGIHEFSNGYTFYTMEAFSEMAGSE
jgi:hypothetical protein